MTRKEKKEAQQAAGGFITSGLAGLSAYFMAATIRALRPQDAMCLLLPGSWCETRYGRELREWIWGARNRRIELHVFPSEVAVFPGTQVTAMILVVGPEKSRRQEFVVRDVNLDTAGAGQVISRRVLTYDRTVQCPSTFSELLRTKSKTVGAQIALGEIAKVRRGVATGASDFFFVTDSTRIEFDLPLQVLREALVKPAHCSSLSFTRARHDFLKREGLPCWLLDLNGNSELCEEENIARYLHEGILRGAHNTHLAQQRKSWHTVELVSAPDIFIAPVGKREHRVILNSIKAVGSNNLYGLYLSRDTLWKPFYLAAWFRSEAGQAALQDVARQYQGGSLKIEPRALRSLSIPATPP